MQNNTSPIVRLSHVEKDFGDTRVVKDLNLDIAPGEFLTLLGPSGCGKTTTLRMIAGFETASRGEIFLEGIEVSGKKPNERDVNTVFQNYALFPHMNVEDNIAFGLVEKRIPKQERRVRVEEMIKLVQLEGMEKRMPDQMSGGQKQRVAIARALVNRPKVLLLDEPLGALDLKLRKQMQLELKHLQKKLGITFIYVTHDQEEALTMSDRIAVMKNGYLKQVGTPEQIYNHPTSKFVAGFIGETNIIEAYVEQMQGDKMKLSMESGSAWVDSEGFVPEEMVYVCVRPEHLKISGKKVEGFNIRGRVKEHIFVGSSIKTVVELANEQELRIANTPEMQLYGIGSIVNVYWKDDRDVILHTKEEQIYNIIEQSVQIGGGNA